MKQSKAVQALEQINERLNAIYGTVNLSMLNSTDHDVTCALDLVGKEIQRVINFSSMIRNEIESEEKENVKA